MADWIRVDEAGVVTRDAQGSSHLGERPGRYAVMPSAPDLLVAVRLPAAGGEPPPARVLLCGDLGGTSFPDLVNLLVQGRRTGVLRVLSRTGDRTLVFGEGDLRGASSTHPGDRLGEIAVRMGLLAREKLDAILASDPGGRRLGRRLVEEKLLGPHDVWKAIQEQVAAIFHAILLGEDPAPFLFTDEPVQTGATAPALSAQALLMDGLRRLDELSLFRKRIPDGKVRVRPGRAPEATLAPLERQIVTAVARAERSVEELAAELRAPEFEVTKAVYHLAEAGLASLVLPGGRRLSEIQPTGTQLRPVVRVFNQIFREIASAVEEIGSDLRVPFSGALTGERPLSPLLAGIMPAPDLSLPEEELLARAAKDGAPRESLLAAMQEAMFFLLFAAAEVLDAGRDEEMNRRVKLIFGMLEE